MEGGKGEDVKTQKGRKNMNSYEMLKAMWGNSIFLYVLNEKWIKELQLIKKVRSWRRKVQALLFSQSIWIMALRYNYLRIHLHFYLTDNDSRFCPYRREKPTDRAEANKSRCISLSQWGSLCCFSWWFLVVSLCWALSPVWVRSRAWHFLWFTTWLSSVQLQKQSGRTFNGVTNNTLHTNHCEVWFESFRENYFDWRERL